MLIPWKENKYTKKYLEIIRNAKDRELEPDVYEKHHIIPKSLGGCNEGYNLVKLTLREHYICHLLLTKMYEGIPKQKMCWALHRIAFSGKYYSRNYELARIIHRENVKFSSKHRDNKKLGQKVKESFNIAGRREINSIAMKKTWATGKLSKIQSKLNGRKSIEVLAHKLEYNGVIYLGYRELYKHTGVTEYRYKKYFKKYD